MDMVPCWNEVHMTTLGFVMVFLAAVLSGLPCKGFFNFGLFVLGLFFIYRG